VTCWKAITAQGLYLVDKFKKTAPLTARDARSAELARHASSTMIPRYLFPRQCGDNQFQIMFHNVQSLNKHELIYETDSTYTQSVAILMAETWKLPGEFEYLCGHHLIASDDCVGQRKAIGSRCYFRQTYSTDAVSSKIFQNNHGSVSVSGFTLNDHTIISVYSSAKASFETLSEAVWFMISNLPGS